MAAGDPGSRPQLSLSTTKQQHNQKYPFRSFEEKEHTINIHRGGKCNQKYSNTIRSICLRRKKTQSEVLIKEEVNIIRIIH